LALGAPSAIVEVIRSARRPLPCNYCIKVPATHFVRRRWRSARTPRWAPVRSPPSWRPSALQLESTARSAASVVAVAALCGGQIWPGQCNRRLAHPAALHDDRDADARQRADQDVVFVAGLGTGCRAPNGLKRIGNSRAMLASGMVLPLGSELTDSTVVVFASVAGHNPSNRITAADASLAHLYKMHSSSP